MVKIYILIAGFFLSTISLKAYTEKEFQTIIKQNEIIHQIDSELNVVYFPSLGHKPPTLVGKGGL